MIASFEIKQEDLKKLIAKLEGAVQESVIKRTLTDGALLVQRFSKDKLLSGPRPTYLGVVSGRLRSSISATQAEKSGDAYISKVGTNVQYAPIHEFGFKGGVWIKPFMRKNKRTRSFSFFTLEGASKTRRKVRGADSFVSGHLRMVDIKQRPFLRPALDTNRQKILDMFVKNINEALAKQ